MRLRSITLVLAAAACLSSMRPAGAQLVLGDARGMFISGNYPGTAEDPMEWANGVVGAAIFYNSGYFGERAVIANVEAGYIWGGHEVFDRSAIPAGSPGAGTAVTEFVSAPEVVGEFDFHATMVGHILAGTGYVDDGTGGSLTYAGMGMAPFAQLWSGAIATSYSSTDLGSFETTTASILAPYKLFFRGIGGRSADVINSSWGGSGDAAAVSDESLTIDALARENPITAFVAAAGNGGAEPVSAPGSGYNNITVGSLGGPSALTPSTFSSRGAVDFFNPEENGGLGVLHVGVRAAVDIAAPGEQMFLAAYLGPTGTLQYLPDITQDPSPTGLFFISQNGTSFAAPTVAGGIALLKDVAMGPAFALADEAFDTRVIKSVLMASSTKTVGWDNGQAAGPDDVVRTTRALDYATGAGALDLTNAAVVYLLSATRDVPGTAGGMIAPSGWDFGAVAPGHSNDYVFDSTFSQGLVLTLSLNWFAGTSIDAPTDLGRGLSFADLNLELSLVTDGVFVKLVAESATLYNNTEFLRVDIPAGGQYMVRVTFLGLVYGPSPAAPESYGLAWSSAQPAPIPEPPALLLIALGGGAIALWFRSRKRRQPGASKNRAAEHRDDS